MSEARNQEAQQLLAETEKHKTACSRLLAERWLSGAGPVSYTHLTLPTKA